MEPLWISASIRTALYIYLKCQRNSLRHPLDAVSIGDIVDVKVLDVNMAKRRITLSMKLNNLRL